MAKILDFPWSQHGSKRDTDSTHDLGDVRQENNKQNTANASV